MKTYLEQVNETNQSEIYRMKIKELGWIKTGFKDGTYKHICNYHEMYLSFDEVVIMEVLKYKLN